MYQKLIYKIEERPPLLNALLLSFQHCILICSTLFLPAIMLTAALGGNPEAQAFHLTQSSMIVIALATFLMYFRNNWIGAGFLCPYVIAPGFLGISVLAIKTGGLPLLFGMSIISGVFQVILSFCYYRVRKIIPTEVMGVVIIMIGVGLISPIMRQAFGLTGNEAQSFELRHLLIFGATFFSIVVCSIWGPRLISISNLLIGCVIGYLVAYLTGELSHSLMPNFNQVIYFSPPTFPSLFHISFNKEFIITFMIGGFATSIKAIGNISTSQKINDPKWIRAEPNTIKSTIFTNGVMTIISSLIGGMPIATSSSNIAFSQATKVTSRILNVFIAIMLLLITFIPKITLFIISMPSAIRSAVLAYVVCFIIVAGIQVATSRLLDVRRALVVGSSLILGLTLSFFPVIVEGAGEFFKPVLSSPLTSTALAALLLSLIFRIGIKQKIDKAFVIGEGIIDNAYDFLMEEGEEWGAPKHVIDKTYLAMKHARQLIKLSQDKNQKGKKVHIHFEYDEYQLNTTITYPGKPVDLNPQETAMTHIRGYEHALNSLQEYTDYLDSRPYKKGGRITLHVHA